MSTISRFVSALAISGLCLLGLSPLEAATYYVSTSGNDSNNGTSTAAPWRTVSKATQTAIAGDTVYIKAGLYQQSWSTVVRYSGTAAKPIVFEGYKVTPGDRPTYPSYKPGDTLNSAEIPVIQGQDAESGFYLAGKQFITIRNLGVTGFGYGFLIDGDGTPGNGSDYCQVLNVFVAGTDAASWGMGVWVRNSDHVTISNCTVTDAAMCNIQVETSNSCTVSNCNSYAVTNASQALATDYHIVVKSGHNNTVSNCLAHTILTGIGRHGIGIKDESSPHSYGNTITNCVVRNCGEYFFIAYAAYSNTFSNCTAYGDWQPGTSPWSEGIGMRDGAHDNTFSNCRLTNVGTALTFQDTTEGGGGTEICRSNTVQNCVFANSRVGIDIWNANSNTIKNCVFNNIADEFIWWHTTTACTGNTIRNTIVSNSTGVYQVGSGSTMGVTYSDFYGNSFAMPAGTGNKNLDPLYADVANKDFHLKSTGGRWNAATSSWVLDTATSPCIDAGKPSDVYSTEPTPNGRRVNIGAYGNTAQASKTGRTPARPTGRIPAVPSRNR